MHNLGGVKIAHERALYTGTCLQGDSAHSLAWRGSRRAIHSNNYLRAWMAGQYKVSSFIVGAALRR